MPQTMKDVLAVIFTVLGALLGIFGMLRGEMNIAISPEQVGNQAAIAQLIEGIEAYCTGIGLIFLIAGMAYILVGQEEELSTVLAPPDEKKS